MLRLSLSTLMATVFGISILTANVSEAARRRTPARPARNCMVSLGGVGMPQGRMDVNAAGIDALQELGYRAGSEYSSDLFLWIDVNCVVGPLGSICTPTAKLRDLKTQAVLATSVGQTIAAFGVYSVAPETAIRGLPRCEELR